MRKKTACSGWYGSCFDLVRSTKIEAPVNWPLAKILQRHGDAETGFKGLEVRVYGSGMFDLEFQGFMVRLQDFNRTPYILYHEP
jgi:hypothetical protein